MTQMGNRLEGKHIVVTGAAAGIGRASATRFAAEGALLGLIDIDADGLAVCAEEIHRAGGQAFAFTTDLTKEDQVRAAFAGLEREFVHIDGLFNCAGGSSPDDSDVLNLSLSTFSRAIELELQSVVLCSREAIPRFGPEGGVILNMSSWTAERGSVRVHAYIAAKGGVGALTRAMASSYASRKIRVNALAPGFVSSERAREALARLDDELGFRRSDYPFATGTPEEMAAIALFLISDESRMINGQIILAEGGVTAY
jgi:NAD(P)-dependent dehydrogenase (short-subunit alcohol dehydrogenase family)